MQAVILAAGEGSRLRPLSNLIPKALMPIDTRPVIDELLKMLIACGFREFVVVVGHLGEKIKSFLGDGSPWGIKIDYAYQNKPLGSGDALIKAKNSIAGSFLVTACDTLFLQGEVATMLSAFDPVKCDVSVGLRKFSPDDIGRRSTVKMDQHSFIHEIIEKPRPGKELSNLSAVPIFLFTPTIWPYLESLNPSKNGKYELAMAIQNLLDGEGGKVKGHLLSYSRDVTYPKDILEKNFPYLKPYL